jgi:hypothetical protein
MHGNTYSQIWRQNIVFQKHTPKRSATAKEVEVENKAKSFKRDPQIISIWLCVLHVSAAGSWRVMEGMLACEYNFFEYITVNVLRLHKPANTQ